MVLYEKFSVTHITFMVSFFNVCFQEFMYVFNFLKFDHDVFSRIYYGLSFWGLINSLYL